MMTLISTSVYLKVLPILFDIVIIVIIGVCKNNILENGRNRLQKNIWNKIMIPGIY